MTLTFPQSGSWFNLSCKLFSVPHTLTRQLNSRYHLNILTHEQHLVRASWLTHKIWIWAFRLDLLRITVNIQWYFILNSNSLQRLLGVESRSGQALTHTGLSNSWQMSWSWTCQKSPGPEFCSDASISVRWRRITTVIIHNTHCLQEDDTELSFSLVLSKVAHWEFGTRPNGVGGNGGIVHWNPRLMEDREIRKHM